MKVKLIKSITVDGSKVKKGDMLDASPKVVEKLILRGYATTELDETVTPDESVKEEKNADKSVE
tara:strand:- start:522 stop:713 length:192 start_codon:yes stop_codon:yes gene_type:complete